MPTTFSYTGAVQQYVVPAGVNYITAILDGGAGSPGVVYAENPPLAQCGPGARVVSVHKVTPGETLNVYVGQKPYGGEQNVFGGGGVATASGGNPGGGASDIRQGGTALTNRIAVAAGGGGLGFDEVGDLGGGAAGLAAANGKDGIPYTGATAMGGKGGTQTAGGAGGAVTSSAASFKQAGYAGVLGKGGNCTPNTVMSGSGGGGGGYYGGGSGGSYYNGSGSAAVAGGAGGSSAVLKGILKSSTQLSISDSTRVYINEVYDPAEPTVWLSTGASQTVQNQGRIALGVDPKELHPSPTGTKTITYEFSKTSDFSAIEFSSTINHAPGTQVGKQAGDAEVTIGSQSMLFWLNLPSQGTWYYRVRTGGNESLPSSDWVSGSFTSVHVPGVTVVSPTGAAFVEYTPTTAFRISTTDPWSADRITAYQIIAERNDNGVQVLDTGKSPLADPPALGQTTLNVAIPNTAKDVQLRWKVRVWDWTDVPSAYSEYSLFTLVDKPAVSITYPAEGGTTDTGAPGFTWTVGLTSGRTVAQSKVTVRESETNTLVWQKTISGSTLSATPETTVLVNQVSYSITVDVTDSVGLVGSDSNLFTTSYVSPDPILYTVDATAINHPLGGYAEINWSNQSADPRLVAWRVYRRTLPDNTWELIEEIPDEGVKFYRDYLVQSGKSYMWTVTQLADRSGAILESPVGVRASSGGSAAESQIELLAIDNYWIICPDYPELTMLVPNCTSGGWSEEYEEATYGIIGRGRHRDYGDRLGYEGTLTSQIRQPERRARTVERAQELRAAQENYYLRDPFGRLVQVALGNISFDPEAGTGPMEMGELQIPWVEVA